MPRKLAYEEGVPAPPSRRPRVGQSPGLSTVHSTAAKLPSPQDNCAIAVDPLAPNVTITLEDGTTVLTRHEVLEGHRFAVRSIPAGDLLLSWGEPFGRASRPIAAGEWICNAKVLAQLHGRGHAKDVQHPNFQDYVKPANLSAGDFVPGARLPLSRAATTFDGFVRAAGRGAGTRNYLVILPLSSVANSLARALEKRLRAEPDAQPLPGRFDGVVALPHTEDGLAMRRHGDGAPGRPHHKAHHAQSPHEVSANHALLCRTLVGLLTHPNVGAAIVLETAEDAARYASVRGLSDGGGADAVGSCVDRGATSSSISSISSISSSISTPGGVCYATITASASESGLSERLASTPHRVCTVDLADFGGELGRAAVTARTLLPAARGCRRSKCAASALVVAQQCGGSDAFSGTAANPLLADASKMLVEAGGSALLAETDELIGAEQYVLQSVRDFKTAERFVGLVGRFTKYAADHHTSAEGNPSGGNMLRGLYNIALKSLGAAMKRHPNVRLEQVVEYAEVLPAPTRDEEAEMAWTQAVEQAAEKQQEESPAEDDVEAAVEEEKEAEEEEEEQEAEKRAPYGAGCVGPGYCFMDSPGNDLESIAGQVASGCNVIYFSTGNGSITNFPFVPTIKVISTTKRYRLMRQDMDVDAGDISLSATERASKLFELTLSVASGERTRGELAGHYQLQIWRNWIDGPQPSPEHAAATAADAAVAATAATAAADAADAATSSVDGCAPAARSPKASVAPLVGTSATGVAALVAAGAPPAASLCLAPLAASAAEQIDALSYMAVTRRLGAACSGGATINGDGVEAEARKSAAPEAHDTYKGEADERPQQQQLTSEHVALLLPTSLCSSEVTRVLARDLQARLGARSGVRFVALPHTEGCGVSDERVGAYALLGHLSSPLVEECLLLEHGCEKTHNDYFSNLMAERGLDTTAFGWASLQVRLPPPPRPPYSLPSPHTCPYPPL